MTALVLNNMRKYGVHDIIFNSLRGLAIQQARYMMHVASTGIPDLTDSSTGTAATSIVDMTVPTAVFDATSAGGASRSALNTALGKIENAGKVLTNSFNKVRAKLGLALITAASGTEASANVIPAQDLTVASTSSTSAVDYTTGQTALNVAKANINKLVISFNEILSALGETRLVSALTISTGDHALGAIVAADASASGASSISVTVANAFLAASAANLATIATYYNYYMTQGAALTDLTDSTGGTAAAALAVNALPAISDGAATTSSPKAGFDTVLGVIENNICELTTRMNVLRAQYGFGVYTDSTGQTPNGTLESQSVNLTAVDGSSGSSCVEAVSARARMVTIANAFSSLGVGINEVAPYFGVPLLGTDALAGVQSTTIANIASTSAGTSGAASTLLDTDVDAWLVITRNNTSTLAAKLNAMTGAAFDVIKPLMVVAG